MALKIGNKIEKVLELDVGSIGSYWGKFLRLRISVDISKPLLKAVNAVVRIGKTFITVFLAYVHLPKFLHEMWIVRSLYL